MELYPLTGGGGELSEYGNLVFVTAEVAVFMWAAFVLSGRGVPLALRALKLQQTLW